jgi:hypothetical protein
MATEPSIFTASDYAAWWGATIATLALFWNIIVALRSGARVRVKANPNMKVYPPQPLTGDKDWISVTAINCGTSPTTITHCCGYYSASFWDLIRGKKQQFIINCDPRLGSKIPTVLAPGEEWSNLADQQGLKEQNPNGFYYIGIMHNQKKRPIYKRVKIDT